MPEAKTAGANITFKLSPEKTDQLDRFIDRITTHTVLGRHRPTRIQVVRKAIDMFLEEYAEPQPGEVRIGPPGDGAGEGADAGETLPADGDDNAGNDKTGAEAGEAAESAPDAGEQEE